MNRRTGAGLAGIMGVVLFLAGIGVLIWVFQPFKGLKFGSNPLLSFLRPADDQPVRYWFPFAASGEAQETELEEGSQGGEASAAPHENAFAPYFVQGRQTVLRIQPPDQFRSQKEIRTELVPGSTCAFGEKLACVSQHWDNWVTLLTVHSGLGGEGEPLRQAVEGRGIFTAGDSLEQIDENLKALTGATVSIQTEDRVWNDLKVQALVRVPPEELLPYFDQPFDHALLAAAENNKQVMDALHNGRDMLVVEFCGWQVRGEEPAPGTTATTASVYLMIIQVP